MISSALISEEGMAITFIIVPNSRQLIHIPNSSMLPLFKGGGSDIISPKARFIYTAVTAIRNIPRVTCIISGGMGGSSIA